MDITHDFLPVTIKSNSDYVIKKGVYHIYSDDCAEKFYYVSNNDCGNKNIRFFVKDKKNISFDFSGSTLVFHGRISPFLFDNSQNVCVKNVKIEYDRPFYTAGKVIKHSDEKIELIIDKNIFPYRVEDGELIVFGEKWENDLSKGINLFLEYDKKVKRPAARSFLYLPLIGKNVTYNENAPLKQSKWQAEETDGRLYLSGDFSKILGNDRFVLTHEKRDNNIFSFINCKKISLENIAIKDSGSMGALFQNCKDVFINKMCVKARKKQDFLVSTNCDATHFCNCRGTISIENCLFENMMDDACNIHGIYLKTQEVLSNNTVLLKLGHFQQYGVNNFKKGDAVKISSPDMRAFERDFTVESATLTDETTIKLVVKESLEGVKEGFIADNLSAHPKVFISHCKTGNNRPRGFLINTDKRAIIENCIFYNSDCGINIAGDNSFWFESTAVQDVTVKNNVFKRCGYYGAGYCIVIQADIIENPSIPDFHQNVRITDNKFVFIKGSVSASNVSGLIFKRNTEVKSFL